VDLESWAGRYRDPSLTPLELRAIEWLDGFYELEHLLCTREWALRLRPHASLELRLAALVHDCERHFPGGPPSTPRQFDDPAYLFAHSIRSAEFLGSWLDEHGEVDAQFRYRATSLVLRHEVGGGAEADVLQAADSLSFLETLRWLTVEWVKTGRYGPEAAKAKHRWMLERIRPPEANVFAIPLYEQAIDDLDHADEADVEGMRKIVGDYRLLLGLSDDRGGAAGNGGARGAGDHRGGVIGAER